MPPSIEVVAGDTVEHDRMGIVTSVVLDLNVWWAETQSVLDKTIVDTGLADMALAGPRVPATASRRAHGTSFLARATRVGSATIAWTSVVFLVPLLGVILSFIFGKSRIDA